MAFSFLLLSSFFMLSWSFDYQVKDKTYKISDNWVWKASDDSRHVYNISLTNQSFPCGTKNSSSCYQNSVDYGQFPSNLSASLTPSADGIGFELLFEGGIACPQQTDKKLNTKVKFLCGKGLGELEFIEKKDCIAYFEFVTDEVCLRAPQYEKQIPCYVILDDGRKIDLMHLQYTGPHTAIHFYGKIFKFNVCTNLKSKDSPCPKDSSVCYGNNSVGAIGPKTSLTQLNNGVELIYLTTNCATTIQFICPTSIDDITKAPLLRNQTGCNYNVVWFTEFACPVEQQIVKNNCVLKNRREDINITSLGNAVKPWKFVQEEKDANYTIFLNVCGKLGNGFECGTDQSESVSVCQHKNANISIYKVLGRSTATTLRYVDEQLIYVYGDGDKCSSGVNRSTVIVFTCNITASNGGLGEPVFSREDECTYFIHWQTSHACYAKRPTGLNCRVTSKDGTVYDLTPLEKHAAWSVLDESYGMEVRVSVCGYLPVNQGCDSVASVCDMRTNTSLGSYHGKQLQLLDDNALMLIYTDGANCMDGHMPTSTTVLFICSPGNTVSQPVIVKETCHYTITWETAHACPVHLVKGSHCNIKSTRLGLDIDLSYLKGRTFKAADTRGFEYELSICSGSTKTLCNKGDFRASEITGCQSQLSTHSTNVIGLYKDHSKLIYTAGIVELIYSSNITCHNNDMRKMHVTFVCNETAGVGEPHFQNEHSHCYYMFLWGTKYVCLPQPGVCSVKHAGKFYDLSPLTQSDMHASPWTVPTKMGEYYINVCRAIPHNNYCSPLTAVCLKTASNTEVDYGGVTTGPLLHVTDNGDVELRYHFVNNTCSVLIQFTCDQEGMGSPEIFENPASNCSRSFKWSSSAACAQVDDTTSTSHCSLTTSQGNMFNLTSLFKKHGYNVTSTKGEQFNLNICGKAPMCKQNHGACIIKGKQLGKAPGKLVYKTERLKLIYKHGEANSDGLPLLTVISFFCNANVSAQSLKFEMYDAVSHAYHFTMVTVHACKERDSQCKMESSSGNVYDLQPLANDKGYWKGLSRHNAVLGFFINLCYPLKNLPAKQSCSSLSRACIQTQSTFESYTESRMNVYNQVVSMVYLNKTGHNVQIFFHCSKQQGTPYYFSSIGKTFVFNWLTPLACPSLPRSGKRACSIASPGNDHLYNMSSLQSANVSLPNNEVVMVSICKANSACGSGNSAACLKTGSSQVAFGDSNDKLSINKYGELYLVYKTTHKTTTVKFLCQRDGQITAKKLDNDDNIEITWPTPLACKPKAIDCSFVGEHANYDLSPLSRTDLNWRARLPTLDDKRFKKSKFFINVCRPLYKTAAVTNCSSTAAMCIVTDSNIINVGEMRSSPYLKNRNVMLSYTNGDTCANGKRYSANITLLKDNSQSLGEPMVIEYDPRECTYYLTWTTSAAWPIIDSRRATVPIHNCTVERKLDGFIFNVNPLHKPAGYKIETPRGTTYTLTVCGALNETSGCPGNSGICSKSTDSTSHVFAANYVLLYNEFLYMKFKKDGTEALVTFICDEEAGVGHPQLVNDDTHTPVFVWRTLHACLKAVQCTAFAADGTSVDLSALSSSNSYQVNIGEEVLASGIVSINVCRGVTKSGCPNTAFACHEKNGKALSLGTLSDSPKLLSNGVTVQMNYTGGDKCLDGAYRSTVTISCDKKAKVPVVTLTSIEKCVYLFKMKTNTLCKEDVKPLKSDCVAQLNNRKVDFTQLDRSKGADHIVVSKDDLVYHINLCKTSPVCGNNERVCTADQTGKNVKSLGTSTYIQYENVDQEQLLLYFGMKEGARNVTIQFICDFMTAIGQPYLLNENVNLFSWKTSIMCAKKPTKSLKVDGIDFNMIDQTQPIKSDKMTFYTSFGKYRSKNNDPEGCPVHAAVCFREKSSDPMFVMGLVDEMLVETVRGKQITLRYMKTNYYCRDGKTAAVELVVVCKQVKTAVPPEFVSYNKSSCTFQFTAMSPACQSTPATARPPLSTPSPPSSTPSTTSPPFKKRNEAAVAFVAVGIILSLALICLALLLKSPQRRAAFCDTVCFMVCRRKGTVIPNYKYTKLSASGSDDELKCLFPGDESSDDEMIPL